MSEFVTVAKIGEIPHGEGRVFEIDEQLVAVFNNDGNYFAIDDMCPHMGASLAAGFFETSDCTVTCPWHAWRFDTRDGSWCDNRRLKIDTYRVRLTSDEIQIAPRAVDKLADETLGDHSDELDSPSSSDVSISHPAKDDDGK